MTDTPIKLSRRALAHLRVYQAMNASGPYGMGGILKRETEKPKITLRRAEYEKQKGA
jgi:hypothetical protein